MKPTIITFTSCVSDLTYRGHPSIDENFIDCSQRIVPWPETGLHWRSPNTDPVKTMVHLKELLREFNQPVTWVINDNEYKNLNGTLPYLTEYQKEGDSILVTYEIVQRPSPVNRKNTEEVLRYAFEKCTEAGIRIDGVWSLKFWESDIEALSRLSHEFEWAKNLAGACWMQGNHIDDSGWRGCPFGMYYPALNNIKGCSTQGGNSKLVMAQWLTRDFATGIQLDRIEPYGLDPADPSRQEIGGFENEEVAGDYLADIVKQCIANAGINSPNIIRLHEEVRMYYDEGHDKDTVIRKIFEAIDEYGHRCLKTTLKAAYELYRKENPSGYNDYLYSGTSLDKRYPKEKIMLYEDGICQMHFREGIGNYPYRIYDYTKQYKSANSCDYPVSAFPVLPLDTRTDSTGVEVRFTVSDRCATGDIYGLAVWDRPELDFLEAGENFKHFKSHDGNHLIVFTLISGCHKFRLTKRSEQS